MGSAGRLTHQGAGRRQAGQFGWGSLRCLCVLLFKEEIVERAGGDVAAALELADGMLGLPRRLQKTVEQKETKVTKCDGWTFLGQDYQSVPQGAGHSPEPGDSLRMNRGALPAPLGVVWVSSGTEPFSRKRIDALRNEAEDKMEAVERLQEECRRARQQAQWAREQPH
jgi:hypothetical protein